MSDPGLRRLVDSVLWPGFLGTGTPDWVRRRCEDGLAGVVLFAGNLGEELGGDALDLPEGCLVGIDEEGGTVTRLDAARGSRELGAAQLGSLDDVELTRATARRLAVRSAGVGANVVLGPVADVNTDPRNPVIGTRSFGAEPQLVSRHVAAAVRGIHDVGAACAPKHFPGHGDTDTDTHVGLTVSRAALADQAEVHLAPFAAAVAAGARMIMTAHLVVPGWSRQPATASPDVLAQLRDMGFAGAIVSDALDMGAMRASFGAQAPVVALAAGCDLLCLGNPANPGSSGDAEADLLAAEDAVLAALADGTLPSRRLEEAAGRVTDLAQQVGGPSEIAASPAAVPGSALAHAVAATTRTGTCAPMPGPRLVLDGRGAANRAAGRSAPQAGDLLARGGDVRAADRAAVVVASPVRPGDGCGSIPDGAPVVILVDRLSSPEQRALLQDLAATVGPDRAAVVDLGAPPPEGHGGAGLPVLHVRASSRLAVEAADDLLARGWRAS